MQDLPNEMKSGLETTMKGMVNHKKRVTCVAVAVLLAAAMLLAGLCFWNYQRPKFQDVQVELGTESISIRDFMTKAAKMKKVGFVTDPSLVDLNRPGEMEITLSHGNNRETVKLIVTDTVAPQVEFQKKLVKTINYVPNAEDFVISCQDANKVKIFFDHDVMVPRDYSDVTVTVVVEDGSGNRTTEDCQLSFNWMLEYVKLEYGQKLAIEDVLLDPVRDKSFVDPQQIQAINDGGIGTYTITSTVGDRVTTCTVEVADTTGPQLELRNVQVRLGGTTNLQAFVKSVKDISGVKEVRMVSQMDFSTESKQTIIIEAEDNLGNVSTKETMLWVATDFGLPQIKGGTQPITMAKHSTYDFLADVTAWDAKDGNCEVTCNTDTLDVDTAGTYFITYTAVDNSGNTATLKRKVVVEHDMEDTMAMVQAIADTLSDDPEEIRDYVRGRVYYNQNWGGDDPIWYGFTNRTGNCYVHVCCLKALYDLKGIENQIIWVTDKTHYWLLVKVNGVWKHIDPTPSEIHGRYSLMNDQQRLSTLSGRKWDTSLWPACE